MMPTHQRGFTLIELIIFIVIVGVGMAGILSVMNTVVKSSADPMVRKQTIAIAESLLEEILLKDFAKPTGSTAVAYGATGWNRSLFDCVSDYNGYSSTGVRDVLGASVTELGAYNVSPVVISDATLSGVTLRQVVVSVVGPQETISLTGYRGNY